jgi:hypothetical protein
MTKNGRLQIRAKFEGKSLDKLEALKNHYGVQSDAELVRVLVNEKARQLNANPVEATANVS